MRICVVDTYYPEVIRAMPVDSTRSYAENLRTILGFSFGTFDAYSRHLRALCHECIDVIANHESLQQLWKREHGHIAGGSVLDAQVYHYNPDVLFLQDLSVQPRFVTRPALIAAQCSCAFEDQDAKKCDVIFTSLPDHIDRIRSLGIRAEFLPLAFDPIVLEDPQSERDIDVAFVGGVDRNSHWKRGTDTLELIAAELGERFHWYGYGVDRLPDDSPLRACYRGEAWGRAMYRIYRRSKIVINRHGEIAHGYTNNLRMFECTGAGALLLTEESRNLRDFFTDYECLSYTSPKNAAEQVRWALDHWDIYGAAIARNGQQRTLRDHTYAQRMKTVSETLKGMLCPA